MGDDLISQIISSPKDKKTEGTPKKNTNSRNSLSVRIPDDILEELEPYTKSGKYSNTDILRRGLRLWLDSQKYEEINKKYSFEFRLEKIISDFFNSKMEEFLREIDGVKREIVELRHDLIEKDMHKYEFEAVSSSDFTKFIPSSASSDNRVIDTVAEKNIDTGSLNNYLKRGEPTLEADAEYYDNLYGRFGSEEPLTDEENPPEEEKPAISPAHEYEEGKEEAEGLARVQLKNMKNECSQLNSNHYGYNQEEKPSAPPKDKTQPRSKKPKEKKPIVYYDPTKSPPYVFRVKVVGSTSRYAKYEDKSIWDKQKKTWVKIGAKVGKVLKMDEIR